MAKTLDNSTKIFASLARKNVFEKTNEIEIVCFGMYNSEKETVVYSH